MNHVQLNQPTGPLQPSYKSLDSPYRRFNVKKKYWRHIQEEKLKMISSKYGDENMGNG